MSDNIPGSGKGAAKRIWNIAESVELQAARTPAAIALIALDRVWTYRELIVAVHAIARRLLDNGVQAGQMVGVSMMQTPMHLMTLLAIARVGAISVPVHVAIPPSRRLAVVRRYGVRAIVSGRAEFRLDGVPFIDLSTVHLAAAGPMLPVDGRGPDAPFRIVFSSGTTGEPKGVMYSHRYMLERTRSTMQTCMVNSDSRFLPMDLNFTVGFIYAIGMLLKGGAVVLGRTGAPDEMLHQVRAHAVTHWLLSPAIAEQVARLLADDHIHFPTLTHLRIVGGKPSRRLLDVLFARFTPDVFEHYGSTEAGVIAVATPDLLRRSPESAGRIVASVTAQVVDEDDQPVPAGRTGRLRLKTPQMVGGYYGNPEITARRFRDGWYYTGDLARIDIDGLMYLAGREDDVINIGGGKFDVRDVEQVLESHPMVREAAAFALPLPDGGAALAAVAAASGQLSVDSLHVWARERLGPQCPVRLFVVNDLPRTTTGKKQRERIAAMFAPRSAQSS
jgi:acyl-coenzyme A synthetase/AMP-(fatty) acid ligase